MMVFESVSSKEAQAAMYMYWGESEWRFQPLNGKTKISYNWRVRSNKLLITLLSPFIKVPKTHSKVMQAGFEALNEYLTQR